MDDDDVAALQWQNASPAAAQQQHQEAPPAECDDYWFIPPYTDTHVLEDQLETFSQDTGTLMVYNKLQERIELWGPSSGIQRGKQALDHFATFYHEAKERQQKATRTRGWAKPDRELTPAEKKKKERKDRQMMESQRYYGMPTEELAFNHCVKWPKDLPAHRLLGGDLSLLNPLRSEFKCFIWMENPDLLYVAGNDEQSTFNATNRIRNYILRRIRPPIETVCHVLEKPSKLVKIHMVNSPPVPYIKLPFQMTRRNAQASAMNNDTMFMRAEEVAAFENLLELDRQMAAIEKESRSSSQDRAANGIGTMLEAAQSGASAENDANIQSMKYSDSMTDRNIERIRQALETTLEQVQLMDGEIQMRIRIGQVGLLEYPRADVWETMKLDATVIPDSRLKSEFNPFFTTSSEQFSALNRKLASGDVSEPSKKPDVLWSLGILKRDERTNQSINVQLDITFREDGNVALWNALVQKTMPLNIRVISTERLFSWAWTISAGKRLEADKFSPEGTFVHQLNLSKSKGEDGKLVYSNTTDIQLRHIRREKKWLFRKDPWTIELTEEAFWTFKSPQKPYQSLTLSMAPDETLYSVSMFRDSWVIRLCENPHLGLGQVPSWDPSDFFQGEELISKTMEAVTDVRSMVEGLF